MTIKKSTRNFPFRLVYGTKAVFPIQLTLLVAKFLQEEWNEEEDGTRYVWISGPIGVPSSIECGKNEPGAIEHDASFPADRGASPYWTRTWTKAERQRLLDAVGSQVQATIRFRATGDSPALEEGKDIEWLKPCLLNIEAAELGGADHD